MKREAAAARGEPMTKVGRPPALMADKRSRAAKPQLRAPPPATKFGYGGAKQRENEVRVARTAMVDHPLNMCELQYTYWVNSNGVVNMRLVSAAKLLLRAAHLNVFSSLAKKVYSTKGEHMECLALNGIVTGESSPVALTVELLDVVRSYVARTRLNRLKFIMMNGQCRQACKSESSVAVQPVCDAIVALAGECYRVGRPLLGVNWAENEWGEAPAKAFAQALAAGRIPKFQILTGLDQVLSGTVRKIVRESRHAIERECRQCGEVPWWRDRSFTVWLHCGCASHKCMQGFGCGSKVMGMGTETTLWN